jgi:hypothetical protein
MRAWRSESGLTWTPLHVALEPGLGDGEGEGEGEIVQLEAKAKAQRNLIAHLAPVEALTPPRRARV